NGGHDRHRAVTPVKKTTAGASGVLENPSIRDNQQRTAWKNAAAIKKASPRTGAVLSDVRIPYRQAAAIVDTSAPFTELLSRTTPSSNFTDPSGLNKPPPSANSPETSPFRSSTPDISTES